ncbi:Lactam utilization protein lamB [Friedmanniomyces endolithicus]|uniref:Lactam utilization protein lamB n=1 Tax=Friedmanniomyces endolithicus TaxID=329885 RepID=A0A4U0V8Y2_9PEZI|nr:Lactam utilization protein lamB [Friedmanniomyces endolithicus]
MAPIQRKVHINVDLGEGYGNFKCGPDDELIPLIDHANVACGFHAGDPLIMAETVKTCKQHGIAIGAHPGLPDIQGFGRREMKLSAEELTALTRYQIGALKAFLDAEDVPLHHVKPHGVLYGMMYRDPEVCTPVFGLAGTHHEAVAKELGLPFVAELYGDVKYTSSGTLVIDRKKKAWTPEETKAHIASQLNHSSVTAVTGETVELPIGDHEVSLCCHSDSPGAVEIVQAARQMVDDFNKSRNYV